MSPTSEYNLGTARGVIEIEYRGDGAKQASADLRNTGTAADQAAQRTGKAGTQLATAGVVIAGGLALAVKSAADFEERLSAVQAVSGASAAEMEQLRNKSLQLGKDTMFSASESASAIEELVKAGLSVQDVMGGAADATVALAAAGEVTMPEAAAIASNAMNQFGLSAKDMVGVADNIAGAANASAIDVREFGMSLSQVGAVANLAGANFEDTATAIALMGNAGIKGSDAGTSLKSMLMNLQPDTAKTLEQFKELGIVTEDGSNKFYDAQGNLKSLADVSGILQGSLEGMTKAQQQATLQVMFGADGIRAAAILAKNGAKGFDGMADSMGKVSAADVAATRMDNLKGSVEQLKGSLETLMIVVGTPLLGLLRGLVDGVTGFMNVVLMLPGPVLEAVTVFLSLLAVGLLLVGGIMKVIAVVKAGGAAVALLTGPIGLAVLAIAALVAAFYYFYKNSEQFRAIVQQIGQVIRDVFGSAIGWLIPKLQQLGAFLAGLFQKALPYLQQFGAFLVTVFNAAMPQVQKFVAFLQELAGTFMTDILPVLKQLMSAAIGLGSALMTFLQPAFRFIGTAAKILTTLFTGTLLPLLKRVGEIFFQVFVKVVGNAIRTAMGIIRGVLNIIVGIIKVFTGLLTGNFNTAWEGVKQIFRGAIGAIGSLLRGMLGMAGTILKGLGQVLLAGIKAIPGLLKSAGGLFLAAGKFLMDMFVEGIKNAAGLIAGIAGNVWDFVKGLMNGAINQINAALEFTINPPGPGSVNINPPDIPQLAKGAVITAPTLAWIGEGHDDEAVTPLDELWAAMDRVYMAGRTSLADTELGSRARPDSRGGSGTGGALRLVEGRLYIDKSGRAYIKGVAEEVVAGERSYDGVRSRMAGAGARGGRP